jgi:two-component system chemotaxis sensor kinase CheA
VTDVSGRGVGMDVVKKNITALGGTVEIDSAEGYGMTVRVRLPLTLAIMDGMSVGVGEECYILPLSQRGRVLPGAAPT